MVVMVSAMTDNKIICFGEHPTVCLPLGDDGTQN